jgi:hypothetical protein
MGGRGRGKEGVTVNKTGLLKTGKEGSRRFVGR